MIAVLDTSAAVEVVLKRESSALFSDFIAEADLVNAAMLLITDAKNVFWKLFQCYPENNSKDGNINCMSKHSRSQKNL